MSVGEAERVIDQKIKEALLDPWFLRALKYRWRDRSAWRHQATEVYERQAKAACAGCPVRARCLAGAGRHAGRGSS